MAVYTKVETFNKNIHQKKAPSVLNFKTFVSLEAVEKRLMVVLKILGASWSPFTKLLCIFSSHSGVLNAVAPEILVKGAKLRTLHNKFWLLMSNWTRIWIWESLLRLIQVNLVKLEVELVSKWKEGLQTSWSRIWKVVLVPRSRQIMTLEVVILYRGQLASLIDQSSSLTIQTPP